jgi:hypothetical protein
MLLKKGGLQFAGCLVDANSELSSNSFQKVRNFFPWHWSAATFPRLPIRGSSAISGHGDPLCHSSPGFLVHLINALWACICWRRAVII